MGTTAITGPCNVECHPAPLYWKVLISQTRTVTRNVASRLKAPLHSLPLI